MGENFDASDLKNETKDTVKQVKDTIKNVDIKEDSKAATKLIKEMFLNPVEAIKNIALGKENAFSKAVILMIVYLVVNVLGTIIMLIKNGRFLAIGNNIMMLVKSVLNPLIYILVPAFIVYLYNKANKKSLTTILSTIIISSIPVIINSVIDIVELLLGNNKLLTLFTSPISTMFSAVAVILTYIGMKNLFEEENETFLKKYAIIKLIGALIFIILARIGIY